MIRKTYEGAYFKALDDSTGEFEAVVSVFGNVDLQGDRVLPGAFEKTLETWRSLGDPIPVIWSHQWGDPEAHIGFVMPDDAREITVDESKAFGADVLGGLYVKGRLDVNKPFAAQVYDLLKQRRVREWSFAYDVWEEAPGDDRANDLKSVDLLELGPTLKGANPSTFTLGVKSVLEEAAAMDRGLKKITRALDIDSDVGMKMLRDWVHGDVFADGEEPVVEMKALRDWVRADLIAQAMKNEPEVGKKMLKDWMIEDKELPENKEKAANWVEIAVPDLADAVYFAVAAGLEGEELTKGILEAIKADEKWDGPAAMRSCSTAGDFRKISFERSNDADPDTAAHWTLPHHTSPGAGADDGGVSAALGRLNQTGPTVMSKDSIRNHLERHQGGKAHDEDGNWEGETSEKDDTQSNSTVNTFILTNASDTSASNLSDDEKSDDTSEKSDDSSRARDRRDEETASEKADSADVMAALSALKDTLAVALDNFAAAIEETADEDEEDEKDKELEQEKAELEEYKRKLSLLSEL